MCKLSQILADSEDDVYPDKYWHLWCKYKEVNILLFLFSFKRDIGKVVEALYGENPPPIMIIGHSMGGAIAVHAAAANHIPSLLGLCVIDVVEGLCMLILPLLWPAVNMYDTYSWPIFYWINDEHWQGVY